MTAILLVKCVAWTLPEPSSCLVWCYWSVKFWHRCFVYDHFWNRCFVCDHFWHRCFVFGSNKCEKRSDVCTHVGRVSHLLLGPSTLLRVLWYDMFSSSSSFFLMSRVWSQTSKRKGGLRTLFRTFWKGLHSHHDFATKRRLRIHLTSLRPRREIVN